jgi:hypothetical protein
VYQGPRGSCLMKKTRGRKSRVRVPLTTITPYSCNLYDIVHRAALNKDNENFSNSGSYPIIKHAKICHEQKALYSWQFRARMDFLRVAINPVLRSRSSFGRLGFFKNLGSRSGHFHSIISKQISFSGNFLIFRRQNYF